MVRQRTRSNVIRLSFSGPLTIYEVSDIRQKIAKAVIATKPLQIVTEQVTDIDCAGIQLLLTIDKARLAADLPIVWDPPGQSVLDMMQMLGMNGFSYPA